MASVKVYGADWCSMTKSALKYLEQLGVEYEYINIDQDRKAAQWVAAQNDGKEKKPTIDIDGEILSEPPSGLLERVLKEKGLLSR